jgi:hypothetical protein
MNSRIPDENTQIPDADHARVLKILQRLVAQTRSKKITWEPAGVSSYVYSSTSSSVTVSCRDADDNFPYDLAIFNSGGSTVSDTEFLRDHEGASDIAELYRLAGRHHLEVDATLDNLLSELEER